MVKNSTLLIIFFLSIFALPLFATQPQVNLSLSKDRVWQREQVIVTLEVDSDDRLSRLDAEDFEQDGFSIVPLDLKIVKNNNSVKLIKQWIVFPYLANQQLLELPRIRYRPNSGRPVELKLPKLSLSVRPLPIYVPPTMPVGKVSLKANWQNSLIIPARKMYQWEISAASNQVSPQTLPAISRQLLSTKKTQILPIQRTIETIKNDTGISHQQSYQIPIKAMTMGWLNLPRVEVQYFDPETGKLQKTSLKQPIALVLNRWLLWLATLVLFALLLLMTIYFLPKFKRLYMRKKQKQQALESLTTANDYQQIRDSLRLLSLVNGNSTNITLEQFVRQYETKHPAYLSIKNLIDRIKEKEFSLASQESETIDAKEISGALYKLLR
jgi:hypothetical protein